MDSVISNIKQVFTWQYYKEGFSNWTKQSKIWWGIGLLVIVITGLSHGIDYLSVMSMLGGAIGFTCTLAITNNKKINGLLGFVSAILISIVAWHSKNYSDIVMQMIYVVLLDLNIMLFGDAWQSRKIKAMDKNGYLLGLISFVVAYGLLYYMDTNLLISPRPVIDALAAAIGVTGAILMVAKYHAQYWLWTAQGLLSVTLWGITAMQGDANWVLFMVYALYLGNDVIGLWFSEWATEAKKSK